MRVRTPRLRHRRLRRPRKGAVEDRCIRNHTDEGRGRRASEKRKKKSGRARAEASNLSAVIRTPVSMMKSPASLKCAVARDGGAVSRSNPSIPSDPDPSRRPGPRPDPSGPVCLNARQKLKRGNGSIGMLMTSILVNISGSGNKTNETGISGTGREKTNVRSC